MSTIGPRPRIWCSAGTGLLLPRRGRSRAAVVDQHQALALAILERQRQPAVDFDDLAGHGRRPASGDRASNPGVFAGDAQAGARDRVGSAPLGRGRKIEEGEVGAGIGLAVGVEQMIGADVVLVDGLLDQPHAEQAGIKRQILAAASRKSPSGGEFRLTALHDPYLDYFPGKIGRIDLGLRRDHVGYGRKTRQRQPLPPASRDSFMTGHLIVTDEDATRVITLRRPEKKNAITQDMYRAMSDAIDNAQNNPNIRCIIITGGSGVFTAGNDLEDFLKDGTSNADTPARLQRRQIPLFAGAQRQADHRRGRRRRDRHRHHHAVPLRLCARQHDRDVLDAVHPSRAGAGRRLQPADAAHHGTPARLRHAGDGAHMSRADDARVAGFVNVVVAPGHTEAEARKVAREICALPAEAVAISRKLLKLPPEDMTRRIDQEGHLFGERMRSKEAVAAFKAFFSRKKG